MRPRVRTALADQRGVAMIVNREELELLASDIAAIEEQLVALATRFEALSHPRLHTLLRFTAAIGPGGGNAA